MKPRRALTILSLAAAVTAAAGAPPGSIRRTVFLLPGTPAEASALTDGAGSTLAKGIRTAPAGGGWSYRLTIPSGAKWEFHFDVSGTPQIEVTTRDGAAVAANIETHGKSRVIRPAATTDAAPGGPLVIHFRGHDGPVGVEHAKLILTLPDHRGDGLGDLVDDLMGLAAGDRARLVPRPPVPHTGFPFSDPYDADLAVPTDGVHMYNGSSSAELYADRTWAEKGYEVQMVLHSRYGRAERDLAAENQTDQAGQPLEVIDVKRGDEHIDLAVGPLSQQLRAKMIHQHGPDITVTPMDYYKLPTPGRTTLARHEYDGALDSGVEGLCVDEPEIWAEAGYSEAFKQAWKEHYGTDWQPPESSVEARYRAEQLKGYMLRRWAGTILEDVQQRYPSAARFVAMHSPLNYYQMRMCTPHDGLISLPAVQDVIAEIWNDPFDLSFLEYSSFINLTRSTGKRLWFMMDPLGDNPAVPMEFYRHSYLENLLAALAFPEVDSYQPTIWPNRLYGHVPKPYEVVMNSVVGAFCELWRYPGGQLQAGSPGLGTFFADSMGWQRGLPSPSDFDGAYGLSLPLVQRGIPVEMLSLDRAAEPGYLDRVKCLLLSYDFLKPTSAAIDDALARWVRDGGTLVCFGGTDAYNNLPDSWWQKSGYASPLEHLFARLGLPTTPPTVLATAGRTVTLQAFSPDFAGGLASLDVATGPSPGVKQYERDSFLGQTVDHPDPLACTYPITLHPAPVGAKALYRIAGKTAPAVWEADAGQGRVIVVGVEPGYLMTAAHGPDWVRALARRGLNEAGGRYREQSYFLIRRGPYMGVRALGKPYAAQGTFVNLTSPTLEVVHDPIVPANEGAFLADANDAGEQPRLLAAAGRLRATFDGADVTSFLVHAPSHSAGVARIWLGSRKPRAVRASTVFGENVSVTSTIQGPTLLLQYENQADGTILHIDWATTAADSTHASALSPSPTRPDPKPRVSP